MHTVQVVALPPNQGRMNFASIGWTWNSRNPANPIVAENSRMTKSLDLIQCLLRSRRHRLRWVRKIDAAGTSSRARPILLAERRGGLCDGAPARRQSAQARAFSREEREKGERRLLQARLTFQNTAKPGITPARPER